MATDLVVPVVKLEGLRPHPNADKLELVNVLGYQMCVPKGVYKDGDTMVYFPADTLIPAAWADKFGVRKYLKGQDQDRVGRIKLRGEPSFGLVVPHTDFVGQVGDNLAELYECKKYEPPIRATAGDAAPRNPLIDPFFDQFTDVQNGRLFTDIFVDGEEVIYTEKIHGTNCKVGIINGAVVAGSMSVRRARPAVRVCSPTGDCMTDCELDSEQIKQNTYWFPLSLPGVLPMLTDLARGACALLYGEVYGGSIQSLDYGVPKGKGLGFRAFGLRVNGKFMDWDAFEATCKQYGVETVPVLGRGPFSMKVAKLLADGKSILADHIREGTVVYPVKEREHPKIGRVILKYIGTEYELSKHKDADTKDT